METKLSDAEIDEIVGMARHVWHSVKYFRGETRKEFFMRDLERLLRHSSSGTKENVCHHCLGTGYSTK